MVAPNAEDLFASIYGQGSHTSLMLDTGVDVDEVCFVCHAIILFVAEHANIKFGDARKLNITEFFNILSTVPPRKLHEKFIFDPSSAVYDEEIEQQVRAEVDPQTRIKLVCVCDADQKSIEVSSF